ncbi:MULTISPECIES: GDSL-type esterase/lipase family protein [unclassified Sphingobacterium]|uniref:GDSL-type esterase/lipase family protein n=1 Tax=unclassified Sphingobacterium TaxID=2609468 RepID=UPI002829B230|nr:MULTISPECIES: GDSL-type esterase/lipase family protein [unclassified Sphingobacterium]MDR2270925.1 GDSL-type esterase/lipase family protein [Sphingobacterium sp.]MDR6734379.1 lysophospholipase L1-like esterase [Sphingobacterium sp. 2149]WON92681.1 GDSL-type esterase/lipase family protein [Sphingobacterium sp. UGAL515B_05]
MRSLEFFKRYRVFQGCFLIGICLSVFSQSLSAQETKIDSSYANWYYQQRMAYFEQSPTIKGAIVFLGNSITERAEWQELLADSRYPVLNRGIGGDNSFGILARIDEVLRGRPRAIFLMDGINDQFRKLPQEVSVNNYKRIIKRIKKISPKTLIYLQSALPINEERTKEPYTKGRNVLVPILNEKLRQLAADENIPFVDLCPLFQDNEGKLNAIYSADGVHLIPSAYIKWVQLLKEKKYL